VKGRSKSLPGSTAAATPPAALAAAAAAAAAVIASQLLPLGINFAYRPVLPPLTTTAAAAASNGHTSSSSSSTADGPLVLQPAQQWQRGLGGLCAMLRLRRGTAAAPVAGLLFLAMDRLLAQWCEALDSEARTVPAPALTALTLGFASGVAAPATVSGLSPAASSNTSATTAVSTTQQQQLLLSGRKQPQQGRAPQSAVTSKGTHHNQHHQQQQHQPNSSRAVLREVAAECTVACVEWAKAATAGAITAAAAAAAAQSTEANAEQCRLAGVSEAGAKRRATGSTNTTTNATASNTVIRGDDCDGSDASRASTAATAAATAAVRETDGHTVEALGRWAVCIKRSMTEAGGCR
jgi:hypothetical protein